MKKFLFLMLFSFLLMKSFSQWGHGFINFEDTASLFRISIDTSVPDNIWQIGSPHKSIFTSSYSVPLAITTDTLNPYPMNNNSVFYYRTSGDYNTDSHDAGLGFWYKMESDTLNDFGKVEISIDTGQTWQNILTGLSWWGVYDSLYNLIQVSFSSDDTIIFTGKTNGWYLFSCSFSIPEMILDSIDYRFTFHSDDHSETLDGWMIDDISFNTVWESMPELKMTCQVYPNPATDEITIRSEKRIAGYEISDCFGRSVIKNNNHQNPLRINVNDLPAGMYFYKIRTENGQETSGKFIKSSDKR